MEHAIEVKDLTKNYGEITAVNHINFEVRKGEIFGFCGFCSVSRLHFTIFNSCHQNSRKNPSRKTIIKG